MFRSAVEGTAPGLPEVSVSQASSLGPPAHRCAASAEGQDEAKVTPIPRLCRCQNKGLFLPLGNYRMNTAWANRDQGTANHNVDYGVTIDFRGGKLTFITPVIF